MRRRVRSTPVRDDEIRRRRSKEGPMTDDQQQHGDGPNLENYSGSGEDLTHEQREYLNTYALHETEQTSSQDEVSAGHLSENAEGEWA
jgi:hypothetical protein